MSAPSMYAIKRLQPVHSPGCWRVDFTRLGRRYEHCFFDDTYRGSQAALQAAMAWRDGMLAHAEAMHVVEHRQAKRNSDTRRAEGVHFLTRWREPTGFWLAELRLPSGPWLCKSFCVNTHGHELAFELAVAARRLMLRTVEAKPHWLDSLARPLAQQTSDASADTRHAIPAVSRVETLWLLKSKPFDKRQATIDGVPGVNFRVPKDQPAGVWLAKLELADGSTRKKSFPVRVHGRDKGFWLAVTARDEMLREVEFKLCLDDPLARVRAPNAADTAPTDPGATPAAPSPEQLP